MLPWLTGDPYFPCTNSIAFIMFVQSLVLDLHSYICNNTSVAPLGAFGGVAPLG